VSEATERDEITPDRFQWSLDENGKPWVIHVCKGEVMAWRLPPPWSLDNGIPSPSLDCRACGIHHFVNEGDRVPFSLVDQVLVHRGEKLGVVGAGAKTHRLAEKQPFSAPSARCPWCECWGSEHTARCWATQRRRGTDPWGRQA
jgi:hypothetical protein